MNEQHLKIFVDSATHYFKHLSNEPAAVQVPYLIDHDESLVYDYTGVIGIAGLYKGNVYFSAPEGMMRYLLTTQGENKHTPEHCLDVVGEIANTLAGNARRELGSEFLISVPFKIAGKPDMMLLAKKSRSYAIPIQWRFYMAVLVVSVEE
ncbi:MAG: chemotaxis protein CheX [Candidatus Competibacteraceae bacterium]|nr:chemotaxis protein CheX [Candidatus Competibacteraceae bacterium]MBK7984997.1 chemotaxis protein CheX [Candidatus Competibacteraceae bacterium]MBK8895922.1 chemotaxis protein CheX [Candidatus Competibacteraceae bacterium]MBK8963013.1 chemotaxis protein CheX [Candidatus Competibacteraceae bacterium]MBK9953052.1 chemotaxis protein CheX [Candidatus Competibacteraceae bacterium]